ncbi:beta family protein [Streptomyces sp. NPDC057702]|uniref:beta family protein n=1 Tax=unclassified Streptomyces TaxID=2593676 RepID=UPI0036AA350F
MSVSPYVPVLPTRPHAVAAFRDLPRDAHRHITPLWTLPPRVGVPPEPLARYVAKDAERAASAQSRTPAWLDAPFADAAEAAVLADTLNPEWWEGRLLRPVTGPGRPAAQQSLALAVVRQHGLPLALRVRLPGEWNDRAALAAAEVAELLGRVPADHPVHLVLDLGTVLPDRPDAGKEALRALDALLPLAPWRAVTVVAGGFPEPPDDFREGTPYEAPRTDWEIWHEMRHAGRPALAGLGYGDYGIHPATYVTRPPASGGGPSWGVLRYTTDRSYHLARVPFGKRYDDANRAAVKSLTGLTDFRGAAASAGERWLCARARGAESPGNHSTWNRAGNIQHMAFVATSLGG